MLTGGNMAVDPYDPNQTTDPFRPKLQAAYQKYLGRDLGQNEGTNWYGRPNWEQELQNSDEAKAFAARSAAPAAPATSSTPEKVWNEDQFWNELLGSGGKTTSDLTNFLTGSGWGKLGVTQFGSKNDKIKLPGGSAWDVVMSAGEGGGKGFYKGSLDGGTSGAKDAGYTAATGSQNPTVSDAISKLFARGFSPVSENDPAIQAQFGATSRTIDRGAQKARQAAAERAAVGGSLVSGEGGAFDATVNGINENAAEQKGGLMAELMGQELQARRQDVITALGAAQGEERMALEAQLQALNRELQKYGIDSNAALSRQGMNNQNQQFYDTLSWNMANSANQNSTLLQTILGLFS